jgi:hypothetical protein
MAVYILRNCRKNVCLLVSFLDSYSRENVEHKMCERAKISNGMSYVLEGLIFRCKRGQGSTFKSGLNKSSDIQCPPAR